MQNLGTLDNRYTLLLLAFDNINRSYYIARDNQNQIQYIIAIKGNNPDDNNNDFPANEINILNILHNVNNPYILHFINHGNGPLILQNEQPRNVAYLVFEDAYINFSLTDCLTLGRFQERHAKLIFKKILNGIQAIHNNNYCHRNISLSNIIFDHNYNPKIYSFDFSCLNANNLQDFVGSLQFTPPEIFATQPYNGFKYDIFSLGQLLFCLVVGRFGFQSSRDNDNHYTLIRTHQYDAYWQLVLPQNLNLSESFKNLFLRMVDFDPNGRLTIEQILNDEWMQEINNLSAEDMNILENEVRHELDNRRNHVLPNQQQIPHQIHQQNDMP